VRKTQKKEKTAHPLDVRAPHLAGVRALATWVRAPRRRARPLLAGVRALHAQACAPLARVRTPLDVRAPHLVGVRTPRSQARPPPGRRARPSQPCAPYPAGLCAPYQPCASPLLVGVRAPPHRRHARPNPQRCAPPSSLACAPYPAGVCAPPRWRVRPPQTCAPPRRRSGHARSCARPAPPMHAPHRWWQKKIYKEGSLTSPLHHAWLCVLGLLCGLLA
jgi:hypothetical protein